jgi:glycine oxidase
VAIIGGGVCGLGIGWRLAAAGCRVEVFERDKTGRAASWAAAGMLAARAEAEPLEDTLLELNLKSQRMWPEWAQEVEAAAGMALDYRDEGTLIVAVTRDDVEQLHFHHELLRGFGLEVEWLSGAETRRREPFLSPKTSAGVYSAGDHQVDNRKLVTALELAYLDAGGALYEETEVTRVEIANGAARGVFAGDELHEADVVVLAAGAWSREIPGLPASARPPIRPIKGQMVALQMDPSAPLIRHVVWVPGAYLAPRLDGRLIIGATVEEKGFDTDVTAGGVLNLLLNTWEALPGIDELPLVESWVGFRPTSRDDAPILGPSPVEGLVMATGHHRNGILLAPITIDAVSDYILKGRLDAAVRPFGIDRFRLSEVEQRGAA